MELIAIDSELNERFIFTEGAADIAVGADENNFQISIALNDFERMSAVKFVTIENSEFGGPISAYRIDTESGTASLFGRTWRGMLADKVIIPNANQDYYILSGTPSEILSSMIEKVEYGSFFTVEEFQAPNVASFKFNRYTSLLDGMTALLKSIGYTLVIRYENGGVSLSGKQITSDVFDNYDCDFIIQKNTVPYNHLICLGRGELKSREVLHLYLQSNGEIGSEQAYFGLDERVAVYDYPNVESLEELREGGIERLKELIANDETLELTLNDVDLEVGQTVTAYEHHTGQTITKTITKKILSLSKNQISINYETEE